MMLFLFEHPLSPYAQKVKIALREKNLSFQAVTPEALGSGAASDAFLEANPRAEVPALIDGNARIFDSTIILEYIEDRWPEPPLLPADPYSRAGARMIEEVCDTHYEAINWGLGEIRWFGRAAGAAAERLRKAAAEQTGNLQAWLTERLDGRDWFGGVSFGWADVSVAPYVNTSSLLGLAPDATSPLGGWLTRVSERQSVKQTFAEGTAAIAGMDQFADALASRDFKREYRDHRLEWMIKSGGMDVVLDGLAKNNIRFSREFN